MSTPSKALTRLIGLLIGCTLSVGFVASGQMPQHSGLPGARLKIVSAPTRELSVAPHGRFLSARDMRPGRTREEARGKVTVTNVTGSALVVRLRGRPSTSDLDRLLRIRITAGTERLFEGRLSELRRWSRRALRLAPAEKRRLAVRAWLPSSVTGEGYRARDLALRLEWMSRTLAGA
jgi:hypothetical protein